MFCRNSISSRSVAFSWPLVWFVSIIIAGDYIAPIWALLCSWPFMYFNSFNPYNNPISRVLLLYPFDNPKNEGREKLSNLPRVTQPGSGRTNSDPSSLAPEPMLLTTVLHSALHTHESLWIMLAHPVAFKNHLLISQFYNIFRDQHQNHQWYSWRDGSFPPLERLGFSWLGSPVRAPGPHSLSHLLSFSQFPGRQLSPMISVLFCTL